MPDVTPDPIMKMAMGFMAAKHLFAANEVGLFERGPGVPNVTRVAAGRIQGARASAVRASDSRGSHHRTCAPDTLPRGPLRHSG